MKELVNKYAEKLTLAGLAADPLICGLDNDLYWNRQDGAIPELERVLDSMNINSLICAEPAEPYRTILHYLTHRFRETITPGDCETRTFLHDLPTAKNFAADTIVSHLNKRKSVIISDNNRIRIVTFGTVSPEQGFVTFSSVCFSCFVLFFSVYLKDCREQNVTVAQQKAFELIKPLVDVSAQQPPELMTGPFAKESQVIDAMIEAGEKTIEFGLVDSYFGNISYRLNDTVFISQTGSSLEELAGCIDPCPLDGSSCAGITASSELTAHNDIFLKNDIHAILHGHPKFAVILSMDCEREKECPQREHCHSKCSLKRYINDIPIVPGEVGTGPTGLCNSLPPAIKGNRGAIVWGHGLFTTGTVDFNEAFRSMLEIENMCRREYFDRIQDS